MDDGRVWAFEESLWTADAEHYRRSIDDQCLMVVPAAPFVLGGEEAIAAVSETPRWSSIRFDNQRVARPQEGIIVVAYSVRAEKEDAETYEAHCTSTYRRLDHGDWRVIQHQQTVPPKL